MEKRFIEGILTGIKMAERFISTAATDIELTAGINGAIHAYETILDDMKPTVTSRNPASVCGYE